MESNDWLEILNTLLDVGKRELAIKFTDYLMSNYDVPESREIVEVIFNHQDPP